MESICLDVEGYANNWFLICACYRSTGKCKITDFIPACALAAERIYAKRKEIIFIGDFNMHMLESSDNSNGPNKDLTNFVEQFCLTNVIHEAARTLRDWQLRLATSGNLQVGISDHDLIFAVKKQKLPRPTARTIEFRSLKNLDQNAFLCNLRNVPWSSSYIFENIDDIWSHWSGLFKQVLNEHAPVKQTQQTTQQPTAVDQPRHSKADLHTKSTLQEISPCTNRLKMVYIQETTEHSHNNKEKGNQRFLC